MTRTQQDTRSHILKLALLLFLEKGYKNVSYQDLVKKIGLSKGAIYHYFASKEELLNAVFDFFSESSRQPVEIGIEHEVTDYRSFRKFYIDLRVAQLKGFKTFLAAEIVKFNWVLFCLEAVEANPQLKRIIGDIANKEIDLLERCFSSLEKNGALPKGKDPRLLAEILYYTLEGAGLVMSLAEDKKDLDFINRFDKIVGEYLKII
jgi:AcrR family transcriptional regulator